MLLRLFFLSFLLLPFTNFATTIKCSNKDYAGKKLDFFQHSDPISGEKELVFTLTFDSEGNCIENLNPTKTIYTFCDFGIYRGMLFLEPKATLNLKLPPFKEKSFADKKNPYYSPISFWIATENKAQLNNKISSFNSGLNLEIDKHFNQLFYRQSRTVYDSLLVQIVDAFPDPQPETFSIFKKLKIQQNETDIFRLNPEKYSETFNDIGSEFWNHEVFINLFDKTFGRQLSFSANSIKGKGIKEAVGKKDLNFLLSFVKTKYKLKGDIVELALLKMLHDGFYSEQFAKPAIKSMVGNTTFSNHSNRIIRKSAENILTKISFLQKGKEAPFICLDDLEGKNKCTNNNTDKYKYIVFADVEMLVCQEHLKYLARIDEAFNKYLETFVILRNTDRNGIEDFFQKNKILGTIIIDSEDKYIETYKVKSFPQCYLLNEKHQVVFENANAPLNGFEQQFGTWLRNELFMRQRNQSR